MATHPSPPLNCTPCYSGAQVRSPWRARACPASAHAGHARLASFGPLTSRKIRGGGGRPSTPSSRPDPFRSHAQSKHASPAPLHPVQTKPCTSCRVPPWPRQTNTSHQPRPDRVAQTRSSSHVGAMRGNPPRVRCRRLRRVAAKLTSRGLAVWRCAAERVQPIARRQAHKHPPTSTCPQQTRRPPRSCPPPRERPTLPRFTSKPAL